MTIQGGAIPSLFALAVGFMAPAPALSQIAPPQDQAVTAVVEAFHAALAAGDSTAALAVLDDGVVILENGRMEDKDHYRSAHLAGDIRFAQAVARVREGMEVRISGDVAWAYSTNITRGQMGERIINAQGAELMVLIRHGDGWLISAIHWSSRPRD